MNFFSDMFLGGAAIAAAIYCLILSRKLTRLRGLDQDLGGAIAVLSKQVDDMTMALGEARKTAETSSTELADIADRADRASAKLEVLVASLHDLPLEAPAADAPLVQPSPADDPSPAQPVFMRRARPSNGAAQ